MKFSKFIIFTVTLAFMGLPANASEVAFGQAKAEQLSQDLQLFPTLQQRLNDIQTMTRASENSLLSMTDSKEYLRNFCGTKRVAVQLALKRYSNELQLLTQGSQEPLHQSFDGISKISEDIAFACETEVYASWFFVGETTSAIKKILELNAKTGELQGTLRMLEQTASALSLDAVTRSLATDVESKSKSSRLE